MPSKCSARRLLSVPWTARRSNQSILKEINPEYSLEGLKLKLQCFGPPNSKNWLTGKDPDAWKDWRQEEKGTAEDEMVGWHHWLNGNDFEQTLGDAEGQGNLVGYSPWGRKESATTEQLNKTHPSSENLSGLQARSQLLIKLSCNHLNPRVAHSSLPGELLGGRPSLTPSQDPSAPHTRRVLCGPKRERGLQDVAEVQAVATRGQ